MDRLECFLLLPWDALLFTATKCTLKTQNPKKNKIKEADESFRNPKCPTQVWIRLPFWEKHGFSQSCPSLHVTPYPLVSSLLRLLCEATLKETNKQGMTSGLFPWGYSYPGSSHRVCLWCSSTKRRCVWKSKEPFAVHGRRSGQREWVLKKEWIKLLYLSNTSNRIREKTVPFAVPNYQSHSKFLSFHLKNQNVAFFFQ